MLSAGNAATILLLHLPLWLWGKMLPAADDKDDVFVATNDHSTIKRKRNNFSKNSFVNPQEEVWSVCVGGCLCMCGRGVSSAGFTFTRALGQDRIQGPHHLLREIFNIGGIKQL